MNGESLSHEDDGVSPLLRRRRFWGQVIRAGFALAIIANVIKPTLDPQGTWFDVMRTALAATFTVGLVLWIAFWWLARRERRSVEATVRWTTEDPGGCDG
jgi:hypothetical protein